MRTFTIVALLAGAAACNLNNFRRTPVEKSGFAKELAVDTTTMTTTASGLRYQELAPGTGATAEPGRTVSVHYTGWLTNGTEFDTSRKRGPYEFVLGQREVIDGWDEGLTGMKVGGRRKLVIPPSLGYGSEGSPPVIPPSATLVFDVELMGVR